MDEINEGVCGRGYSLAELTRREIQPKHVPQCGRLVGRSSERRLRAGGCHRHRPARGQPWSSPVSLSHTRDLFPEDQLRQLSSCRFRWLLNCPRFDYRFPQCRRLRCPSRLYLGLGSIEFRKHVINHPTMREISGPSGITLLRQNRFPGILTLNPKENGELPTSFPLFYERRRSPFPDLLTLVDRN